MSEMQNKTTKKNGVTIATTTTSNLPGLQGVEVIVAKPIYVKENSSKPSKK
jgi:hypothetical protein